MKSKIFQSNATFWEHYLTIKILKKYLQKIPFKKRQKNLENQQCCLFVYQQCHSILEHTPKKHYFRTIKYNSFFIWIFLFISSLIFINKLLLTAHKKNCLKFNCEKQQVFCLVKKLPLSIVLLLLLKKKSSATTT